MLDVCGTWSIVGASFLQGQVPGRKPCPVCSHWKCSTRSGVLVRYALAENMVNISWTQSLFECICGSCCLFEKQAV